MSFTDRFDLEEISYGVTGWNAVVTTNFQKVDEGLKARLPLLEAGETLARGEAVYLASDGKAYRARADGIRQPCIGLAVESAAAGSQVRIARSGDLTSPAWSWAVGAALYLSRTLLGGLQAEAPADNIQYIGYALDPTTVVIEREPVPSLPATVTTTSTTTTTTTTFSTTSSTVTETTTSTTA